MAEGLRRAARAMRWMVARPAPGLCTVLRDPGGPGSPLLTSVISSTVYSGSPDHLLPLLPCMGPHGARGRSQFGGFCSGATAFLVDQMFNERAEWPIVGPSRRPAGAAAGLSCGDSGGVWGERSQSVSTHANFTSLNCHAFGIWNLLESDPPWAC